MLIEKRHEKRMKKGRGLGQFADLRGGLVKKKGVLLREVAGG